MPASYRTIVETKQFKKELRRIEPNPVRADELMDGAKWVLSRDPYMGVQLAPRSQVWFLAMDSPNASVGLYYAFDDDTVHFLSITQD